MFVITIFKMPRLDTLIFCFLTWRRCFNAILNIFKFGKNEMFYEYWLLCSDSRKNLVIRVWMSSMFRFEIFFSLKYAIKCCYLLCSESDIWKDILLHILICRSLHDERENDRSSSRWFLNELFRTVLIFWLKTRSFQLLLLLNGSWYLKAYIDIIIGF